MEIFFLHVCTPSGYCWFLSHALSHSMPQSAVARELAQLCLHPSSSFTPCLAQQVHGRTLLWRTQGDTWLHGHRWLAVSLGPSLQLPVGPRHSRPPAEGCKHHPPRALCCFTVTLIYGSAARVTGTAGWLTSNSLTQSFTAYIGSFRCVCAHVCMRVCFVGTVPVRQPPWYFSAGSAQA